MLDFQTKVKLIVDKKDSTLHVEYHPSTNRTIYDICDYQGQILKTGEIAQANTMVDLEGFSRNRYILLILDGNRVFTKKFDLNS